MTFLLFIFSALSELREITEVIRERATSERPGFLYKYSGDLR